MNKYEIKLDDVTFLEIEAESFFEVENSIHFYVKDGEKEEVVAQVHNNRYFYIKKI